MRKSKSYSKTKFSAETIRNAFDVFAELASKAPNSKKFGSLKIENDYETWEFDNFEEWLGDYRKDHVSSNIDLMHLNCDARLIVHNSWDRRSCVTVEFPEREKIQKVFGVFEDAYPKSQLADDAAGTSENELDTAIFIGHGANQQWRELKAHLQDKHRLNVIAYETGARSGHTIRDILDDMVDEATFAILVMTAEDEQADGSFRARQNVVHEAGLFQGALGFSRAIILLEGGVEKFSNVDGIQYIPFEKGRIAETYGDILATLNREFGRN